MFPVGLGEFPECTTDRVYPGGSHIDRAEPAVRSIVRRAELLGPPAGQGLALIAPREECELARIGLADGAEP